MSDGSPIDPVEAADRSAEHPVVRILPDRDELRDDSRVPPMLGGR